MISALLSLVFSLYYLSDSVGRAKYAPVHCIQQMSNAHQLVHRGGREGQHDRDKWEHCEELSVLIQAFSTPMLMVEVRMVWEQFALASTT
jgi:hypothetical protein